MSRKFNMQPKAAGRVLSAENEKRIRDARDHLDSVLAKLEQELQEDSSLQQHMNWNDTPAISHRA